MRGGVENVLVVAQKIAAGGAAFAVRDAVLIRSVGVHYVDLIAFRIAARGLEDEALAVGRPVGFGVFSAGGELFDVGKVVAVGIGRPQAGDWKQREDKEAHIGHYLRGLCAMASARTARASSSSRPTSGRRGGRTRWLPM